MKIPKTSFKILSAGIIMLMIFASYRNANIITEPPIHQLRIYKIPKQNLQAFHNRFKDHAHRIMKKYGFNIIATWESTSNEKIEFIYLLQWPDKKTMENSWKSFMADQEWKDIKTETSKIHGTFVESIEDRTLILSDYSPQKELLMK